MNDAVFALEDDEDPRDLALALDDDAAAAPLDTELFLVSLLPLAAASPATPHTRGYMRSSRALRGSVEDRGVAEPFVDPGRGLFFAGPAVDDAGRTDDKDRI